MSQMSRPATSQRPAPVETIQVDRIMSAQDLCGSALSGTQYLDDLTQQEGMGFGTHLIERNNERLILKSLDPNPELGMDALAREVIAREHTTLVAELPHLPELRATLRTPDGEVVGVLRRYIESVAIEDYLEANPDKAKLVEDAISNTMAQWERCGFFLIDQTPGNFHLKQSDLDKLDSPSDLEKALVLVDPEALSSSQRLVISDSVPYPGSLNDIDSGLISAGQILNHQEVARGIMKKITK